MQEINHRSPGCRRQLGTPPPTLLPQNVQTFMPQTFFFCLRRTPFQRPKKKTMDGREEEVREGEHGMACRSVFARYALLNGVSAGTRITPLDCTHKSLHVVEESRNACSRMPHGHGTLHHI